MELGQLKTQIMTMAMMKSGSQQGGRTGGGGGNEIFMILYSMILLNVIEWIFKQIPMFIVFSKEFAMGYLKKRTEAWNPVLQIAGAGAGAGGAGTAPAKIYSVTMSRTYKKDDSKHVPDRIDNPIVERVDAVLDYICMLDSATNIRMDTRTSLSSTEDIELTPLLKAKLKNSSVSSGSASSSDEASVTELVLYSSVWKISEIRAWIDEVHANYIAEKNNKLGNRIYYFSELIVEPPTTMEMPPIHGLVGHGGGGGGPASAPKRSYRWDQMPKNLTFRMNEFKTSKSFSNVYGHHVDELKERLDLFLNHPEWYMKRGIPHTLGIMLYGVPGAGKTSTIKALAKDSKRHVFNLSLRDCTTQTQLTNLFFNENVLVLNSDGKSQTFKIPLNKRLYVIEDIDCLSDIVLDRKFDVIDSDGAQMIKSTQSQKSSGEALTKSFLLNLIDGILETPDRILVISANHPERIDSAMIRPGRIDVRIEFGYAGREYLYDMFVRFYELDANTVSFEDIPTEIVDRFTPAEVMECMGNNYKDWRKAIEQLVSRERERHQKLLSVVGGTLLDDLALTPQTETGTEKEKEAEAEKGTITLQVPTPTLVVQEESKSEDNGSTEGGFAVTEAKPEPKPDTAPEVKPEAKPNVYNREFMGRSWVCETDHPNNYSIMKDYTICETCAEHVQEIDLNIDTEMRKKEAIANGFPSPQTQPQPQPVSQFKLISHEEFSNIAIQKQLSRMESQNKEFGLGAFGDDGFGSQNQFDSVYSAPNTNGWGSLFG